MSRGNPRVTLRLSRADISALDEQIQKTNATRFEGPLTRTDFVLAAIREKLAHMRRSRRRRKRAAQPGHCFACGQALPGAVLAST